jgi:hypothetical protein
MGASQSSASRVGRGEADGVSKRLDYFIAGGGLNAEVYLHTAPAGRAILRSPATCSYVILPDEPSSFTLEMGKFEPSCAPPSK